MWAIWSMAQMAHMGLAHFLFWSDIGSLDRLQCRCWWSASRLFGPSRHCGLGLVNGLRFRYRQSLFDLLSRWPIVWATRFVVHVGRYRVSAHWARLIFMCCTGFYCNTYFSYPERHSSSNRTRICAVPYRSSSTSSRQASPSEASISLRKRSAVMGSPLTRWIVTRSSDFLCGSVALIDS